MRIKLDENLSSQLKLFLQSKGHDIETTYDENISGQPDIHVASVSFKENRMLLSLDKEFSDIRKYPPGSLPGIIVFRPRRLGPGTVIPFIQNFINDVDLEHFAKCVVVVDQERIRVRKPDKNE